MVPHRVVIIGGGFGGLHAARMLARAPVEVTLVDRRNFHLFQPLLYQVATGGLSPANIAAPLRSIFRRQRNVKVLLGEVTDIDLDARRVVMQEGQLPYDSLIVATGSHQSYFGHDRWRELAPPLKTIEDATEIRSRVLTAFETAEREADPDRREQWLTFTVVGAGPTGVELAGAVAEIAQHTLRHDFRTIEPEHAKIVLVDALPRILPSYPEELSAKARRQLEQLGVVVDTGRMVTDVAEDHVRVKCDGREETIPTRTVLWCAGVQASGLAPRLAEQAGVETDRPGRVPVGNDLTVAGHPETYIIGDMARCIGDDGQPLPGVAQVAIQQGKHAARSIVAKLRGQTSPPFHYRDLGSMATIGRNRAVAMVGRWRFSGYLAWLAWLLVHLMKMVRFENRVLIFIQWAWLYTTWNRSARLITGHRLPLPLEACESSSEDQASHEEQEEMMHHR